MTADPARPGRKTIDRLANGVFLPMAMLAGMKLDLFTPLGDGAMTTGKLADALGVGAAKLKPLLYALVAAELLSLDGERFANTPEADCYLVRGRPEFMGDVHQLYTELWQGAFCAAESVRTGIPQTRHDFAAMSEDDLTRFFRGSYLGAKATGRMLAESQGVRQCRNLLDVAGGSGGVAIAACEACPGLRATVVDLPSVTPVTRRFVAEAGLEDRVRVETADITQSIPGGPYDAAVMRSIIQVLPPADGQKALVNVGRVVAPGGMVHIIGRVLDDGRVTPLETVGANLVFVSFYDEGQAQTEGDHRAWLAAAGFNDVRRTELGGATSLISARRV